MKAITIFYTGAPIDVKTASQILSAIAPVLADGESEPQIKYFSEEDIAKELLKVTTPPRKSTEEGDNSAICIINMIPTTVLDNRLQLTVALTRQLAISSTSTTPKDHAFCKAMSFIAQGEPVSSSIAKQYHFTKMVRDCVTEVYNTYLKM